MKRSRDGLTLIELLVVIAVGFILIAILFPVFCCTHGCCQRTCLTNLKQIGLSLTMYAQDYNDTLPWNPDPGGLPATGWGPAFEGRECSTQPTTSFVALLLPYVKNRYVFDCPKDDGYDLSWHLGYRESLRKIAVESKDPGWANRISYGFNEVLIASPCRPRTLASLKHYPSEVALFSDAEQPWASSTNRWIKVDGEWSRYWDWDPLPARRHAGGQVFVYADGHAKLVKPVMTTTDQDREGKEIKSGYYPGAMLE